MNIGIESNIGIKNIHGLYKQLQETMDEQEENITLDFSQVERVDLSVITVIKAAYRDLRKAGKQLRMRNVSQAVKDQFYLSGFNL